MSVRELTISKKKIVSKFSKCTIPLILIQLALKGFTRMNVQLQSPTFDIHAIPFVSFAFNIAKRIVFRFSVFDFYHCQRLLCIFCVLNFTSIAENDKNGKHLMREVLQQYSTVIIRNKHCNDLRAFSFQKNYILFII